jgi:hypothetical protein
MLDITRAIAVLALSSLLALLALATVYSGLPTYSRPSAHKAGVNKYHNERLKQDPLERERFR